MNGDALVLVMGVVAALVLALRGLAARRLPIGTNAGIAAAWVVIIVAVTFVISRFVVRD